MKSKRRVTQILLMGMQYRLKCFSIFQYLFSINDVKILPKRLTLYNFHQKFCRDFQMLQAVVEIYSNEWVMLLFVIDGLSFISLIVYFVWVAIIFVNGVLLGVGCSGFMFF